MSEFDFADRYAEAGIAPKSELIDGRKDAAGRIADTLTKEQAFDLVTLYFGMSQPDLSWFRDEFRKADPAFSVVHNERECVLLAALILAQKVAANDGVTILALVTTWMHGRRTPVMAGWLLDEARSTLRTHAAQVRRLSAVPTEIKAKINDKLGAELSAVTANDFNGLLQALGKMHSEAHATSASLAKQITASLVSLDRNVRTLREESQILWWLFAAHSRSLNRPFNAIRAGQAAVVAGIELGELSVVSILGPVAAPAVLERVLELAKKDKAAQHALSLTAVIDGIGLADLANLHLPEAKYPVVFPMLTAIGKAKEVGIGSWSNAFQNATSVDPGTVITPMEMALQTYHEHLLGQL